MTAVFSAAPTVGGGRGRRAVNRMCAVPPVAAPRLRRTANELELALSAGAARLLGSALRRASAELAALVEGAPAPYAEWLSRIVIRERKSGRVWLSVDESGSALVVEGERQYLDILAENIEGFIDDVRSPGDHLHIEYFEGHFYLAPSDISLTVVAEHG